MKQTSRFTLQKGWKLVITDMGLNPADVLSLAGLPADLFGRKDASLTPAEYFRLWRGLEKAAGSDELPLKIGQLISVELFDPPIFASLCSPNLNTALQRLRDFKRLIGPLTLALVIDSRQTVVTLACYGNVEPIPRSLGATEMVFFTQLARLATRQRIIPQEVRLVQLPTIVGPYKEFFGVAPRLGKANSISFSAQDALLPFLTEDAGMWDFFEAKLKRKLSDLDSEVSTTERVRSALLEMLPSGYNTIEETASRLATSKRSLQRRLSYESSSYQEVLNATRQELAQYYLAQSIITPTEIAFLLGFQDGNSFVRAFKNWTGKTPGDYRQRKKRTKLFECPNQPV